MQTINKEGYMKTRRTSLGGYKRQSWLRENWQILAFLAVLLLASGFINGR